MLHDENAFGFQQRARCKSPQTFFVEIGPLVRRIDESDIELNSFLFACVHRFREIHLQNAETAVDLQRIQVVSNDCTSLSGLIDKKDRPRAAADSFDSNSTHAGVAVEK